MPGHPATSMPAASFAGLPGQVLREAYPPELLADWLEDSQQRTLALIEDLHDEQLCVPQRIETSPFLWEVGHLAWFAERWLLGRASEDSLLGKLANSFDPLFVQHADRWSVELPSRSQIISYFRTIHDRIQTRLDDTELSRDEIFYTLLSIFYQDLRGEALVAMRQFLAYPEPALVEPRERQGQHAQGTCSGDVTIPGGRFLIGALPGEAFVYDNEKWAHPVEVKAFAIARVPVTQGEFAAFVEANGYGRKEFWSEPGWGWRTYVDARRPLYWRREGNTWQRREFDKWVTLEPDRPMLHVGWYEAEAYCRWAKRRLPTEMEWELAASGEPGTDRQPYSPNRRRFPWGNEPPTPAHANLDGLAGGCLDVGACPTGDSAWGCRGLLGNVWEWTVSDFGPYPGFAADSGPNLSRPYFGIHKVLRGGCWLTRARLLRNTFRYFLPPDRRDLWTGFRTCALS